MGHEVGHWTGANAVERRAKNAAILQQQEIQRQKNIEATATAEETDMIARRRLLAKKGGRSLLLAPTATSTEGKTTSLGGGN